MGSEAAMVEPVTEPDVYVCSDCLDAIEFSDEELGYEPDTLFRHQARMIRHDERFRDMRAVNSGEEHVTDFSASDCQGCGSRLHGARYGYNLI